ncbi:MAG: transcriptional regulator, PadR-like family [Caulobacteraceae bacterium]|nr:transcriptional regulator, PadR-like family [Caulobacteraceae bacterium]
MFGRHHHHHGHAHHRGPFGFHGRHEHGPEGRGRGGRRGRFFDHGDLRVVVLALIGEQPRHGYEIIKALEEKTGGAYAPSPGVIYPTLSLLEDEGLAAVESEGGRKLYTLTDAGREALASAQPQVDAIFERVDDMHGPGARGVAMMKIARARENLGSALKLKIMHGWPLSEAQIEAIAKAMDDAAKAVEAA